MNFKELANKSDKILFITHLAIGDFTYLQNYFKIFAIKYPHLKIDLLVDQGRGKSLLRRWSSKNHDILFDWLKQSNIFRNVYKDTKSWWQFKDSLDILKKEKYPIVVSLATLHADRYAKYAKMILPTKGVILGLIKKPKKYQLLSRFRFSRFDKSFDIASVSLPKQNFHITYHYSEWFKNLFDINLEESEKSPFINIPKKWVIYGKLKHLKWGINSDKKGFQKSIFINSFAKNKKRCWSFDNVIKLVFQLKKINYFYDASFIINLLPAQYAKLKKYNDNYATQKIFFFTANKSFFQLPSVIAPCDLVISVETSVIHLASALKVPVIALMRQKNPEWYPYGGSYRIICTQKRSDWINKIKVEDVTEQTKSFLEQDIV